MTPDVCPECGALVPDGAKACPECGSDESTGWSESARASQLGIPEDEFDYDEYVKEEFEPKKTGTGLSPFWWIVGVGALLAFLWLVIPHR